EEEDCREGRSWKGVRVPVLLPQVLQISGTGRAHEPTSPRQRPLTDRPPQGDGDAHSCTPARVRQRRHCRCRSDRRFQGSQSRGLPTTRRRWRRSAMPAVPTGLSNHTDSAV
ncbi:hypothetical protein BHM03_00038682, partial [Ensete ventricosum]